MALASISTALLDEDLATSDKSKRFLRTCLNDSRKIIPAGSILQLQHILNISVPKEDRELPRSYRPGSDVLKVVMSDGDFNIYALMYHSSPELSMNTPPGTKIRILKPVSVTHGTFCLSSDIYEVLGGHVPKLVEKWTLQRKFNVKQEWGYSNVGLASGGPPQWKAFGYNAIAGLDVAALRKMKAMDIVNEQKEGGKQDGKKTQFEVQRDQALEEIKDKSLKQNWCPPAKNLMDKELVDLLREGFPLEEAEEALKKFKNPRKALQHLKDTNKVTQFREEQKAQPIKEKPNKWRNARNEDEDAEVPREYQRPTKSISLFGFIEQHIKPETAGAIIKTSGTGNPKDDHDDMQLALSMSVDSYKRESQRGKSKYDGDSDFPSLQDKLVKSKSHNEFQDRRTTHDTNEADRNSKFSVQSPQHHNEYRNSRPASTKRESNQKQYETPNRFNKDTDHLYRQPYARNSDNKGGSMGSYPMSGTNRERNEYRQGESACTNSPDGRNQVNPNGSYGNYRNNDVRKPTVNLKQDYYHGLNDASTMEKSQKMNSSSGGRTYPNSMDRNSATKNEFESASYGGMSQYKSQNTDNNEEVFNVQTFKDFRSGDSNKGPRDRSAAAYQSGNDYGQSNRGAMNTYRSNEQNLGGNRYGRQVEGSNGDYKTRDGNFSRNTDNYGSAEMGRSNFRNTDTAQTGFGDSNYRGQTKPNNDYQYSREGPRRGGYDHQRSRDIPDKNNYKYNQQFDSSMEVQPNNSGNFSGTHYNNMSQEDSYSYHRQNPNSGHAYSNTSDPPKSQNDYYSNSSYSQPPIGRSSSYNTSYGQDRHIRKGRDDSENNGGNYFRPTMVFTRSSNGGSSGEYPDQRELYQLGQGVKNVQIGNNSADPSKYNYQQKPSFNNQY